MQNVDSPITGTLNFTKIDLFYSNSVSKMLTKPIFLKVVPLFLQFFLIFMT